MIRVRFMFVNVFDMTSWRIGYAWRTGVYERRNAVSSTGGQNIFRSGNIYSVILTARPPYSGFGGGMNYACTTFSSIYHRAAASDVAADDFRTKSLKFRSGATAEAHYTPTTQFNQSADNTATEKTAAAIYYN
jgi:hypothetical protein